MNTPEIDPKILARATEQAKVLIAKIKGQYTSRAIQTWVEIEERYGLDFSHIFPDFEARKQQIVGFVLDVLLKQYVDNTENRLRESFNQQAVKRKFKLTPVENCYTFSNNPSWKLYPEQDPVFRAIVDTMFNSPNSPRTLWQNGRTGSGKTEILNAIFDWFLSNEKHKNPLFPFPFPYPCLWFTVPNAVEQTREKAIRAGLGKWLDKELHIIPYTWLTSAEGEGKLWTLKSYTDPFTNETTYEYEWCPMALPRLVAFDEAHALQNIESKRSKAVRAMDSFIRACNHNTQFMFFSATLAERMRDVQIFTCLSDIMYEGQKITFDNFVIQFGNILSGTGIFMPNKEAMSRFRKVFAERLFEIPPVKWPYQMRTALKLYQFKNSDQRDQYEKAEAEFLERIAKLGKRIPSERAMRAIAVGQFRKKCEPIRAEQIVDEMYDRVNNHRKSALMCTAFTGTIYKAMFILMDKYNVKRDEISVIWGGRQDCKPGQVLSSEDLINIAAKSIEEGGMDKKVFRLIQRNMQWQEDRILFGDASADAQDERHRRLKSLGLLGIQTMAIRQAEIKKFMSGQARYCFYTIQSGGTGLSLEHCDHYNYPRELWATPIFSGKEIVQGLGRPHRRNSISDTLAYICIMADTVESEHVAPVLDNKLQCLGEGSSYKDDLTEVLANLDAEELKLRRNAERSIRSVEQAFKDCDDERTQMHNAEIEDEEDEEDEE